MEAWRGSDLYSKPIAPNDIVLAVLDIILLPKQIAVVKCESRSNLHRKLCRYRDCQGCCKHKNSLFCFTCSTFYEFYSACWCYSHASSGTKGRKDSSRNQEVNLSVVYGLVLIRNLAYLTCYSDIMLSSHMHFSLDFPGQHRMMNFIELQPCDNQDASTVTQLLSIDFVPSWIILWQQVHIMIQCCGIGQIFQHLS